MQHLQFVTDYKKEDQLRTSFFALAADTFGLELESWYQEGFWDGRYIPFSYADGDRIVANVSVNLLDLVIDGNTVQAIQLGTVMTHPDYRRQGLSAALMEKVMTVYGSSCELMYLFANESVLDFYPRFGFQPAGEQLFSAIYKPSLPATEQAVIRKLDISCREDLAFIHSFAGQRRPVSQRFGTSGAPGLLMFYCLNVFGEDLYYLEEDEVIAICRQEGQELQLFDVISRREPDIHSILSKLADSGTTQIVFHYTPDYSGLEMSSTPYDSGLFVKTGMGFSFAGNMKHPATSIA
ncbi:GNAT family N-acetyltransferase [Paenibacillus typhae]|uniref:Acetyltransferase (GNAT) domain-containing protein n=1 Tax=Paenibacillus typhae TaxID=1174501 RepID=A0A1G8XTP4_9BACL|nr:GNAT family N-acetyltransferase [Paenibacillus typhae]SDJ93921.1 Acetyltransferase (GNAT) domain-containing protein [Paenibacillus typhae]